MEKQDIRVYDLSVLTKKYENKWVALSTDFKRVLASGDSLDSILKEIKQKEKVVLKVLPNMGYAPFEIL